MIVFVYVVKYVVWMGDLPCILVGVIDLLQGLAALEVSPERR